MPHKHAPCFDNTSLPSTLAAPFNAASQGKHHSKFDRSLSQYMCLDPYGICSKVKLQVLVLINFSHSDLPNFHDSLVFCDFEVKKLLRQILV